MTPLLTKIGFLVEGRAKQLCPVDTGKLRASIQSKVVPEEKAVYIGTFVDYAKYVEYRYPMENPHPGRETGQMPFLRPSIFQSKRKIKELIRLFFKHGGKI